jgi:hypothetical protein
VIRLHCGTLLLTIVLAWLPTARASAQTEPPRGYWIAAGGASTTLQGACGEGCDFESPYRQAGTVLANIGHSVNSRTDAGAEIAWTPSATATGEDIRTTFILGVAQFRPWASKGFSIKGGMGMAFVRNWVYDFSGGVSAPPFTSKALGLTYSAGWTFRHTERVSVQIFGAQHVATLGDLKTSERTYENVIANFWSVGATLVFR